MNRKARKIFSKYFYLQLCTSHSGLVLPFINLDQTPSLAIRCLELQQYAYFCLTWEWQSRETKCLWFKWLNENLKGKDPQMQMEEAHTCSNAVIAGRMGCWGIEMLTIQSHIKQEHWTYRSLGLSEEEKLGNILYHMAAIEFHFFFFFSEKCGQFHKFKSPERTVTSSISVHLWCPGHLKEVLVLFVHNTRKARCSSNHSETMRETLAIRKLSHKFMYSRCLYI